MKLEEAVEILERDLIKNKGKSIDASLVLDALLIVMRSAVNWKCFKECVEEDVPEYPYGECMYFQSELVKKINNFIVAAETGSLAVFDDPVDPRNIEQDVECSGDDNQEFKIKCPECGSTHFWRRRELEAFKSGKLLDLKCQLCSATYRVNLVPKK